jgi:hypothetical protein
LESCRDSRDAIRADAEHRIPGYRTICHSVRLSEHILRQTDDDRAGPPGRGKLECSVDQFTGTACEVDPYYALCQVSECLRQVDFLESSPPTVFARDLAHEKHHGRRVLLRGVDADAGVREARPAGHEGDAGPAAELRGRLGHIGRCSFVSASDHAERVACVVQRIEHIQVTFACHGEYMSRIVGAQPLNDRIGNASHSHLLLAFVLLDKFCITDFQSQ